ncbi:Mg-chelatase subunit ChlD [Pseudonocardia ammonioxydans]|uniref:Mg-chelatase subunit ChlD n=1 Tax=Pseudonocardia ammonioxydans TaxID=260086 RepID=A0A1I4SF69_PSUAM|nr:vWA domain-containing protein [Pseudonocardia ammonioxydans]SFM63119.1 Mg-chelatase subunit ChlD [Pseudonocardia ammonioxydans]
MARSSLAGHEGFSEISPEVGVLDVDAFDAALAGRPDETLELLVQMSRATDAKLRAAAQRLAGRVVLDIGRSGRVTRRGIGRLQTVPADRGGDLDLDASLGAVAEARAARRPVGLDELTARTWARPALALCLVVDASGSMGGDRLATAALTAAACAFRAPGDHAVLSFAAQTQVLRDMGSAQPASAVVDRVLGLRGHGVTALAGALRTAAAQLERTRAERRVVVLLSDCRATDDQDPVPVARRIPELIVLAPAADDEQAADLAARSGARWAPIAGPSDAPGTLLSLLGAGP